jgi:hypothetical protein
MSASRTFGAKKTTPTHVTTPNTISYYDNEVEESIPIPFTVRDGVLDIAIQDNVTADLLTPETFSDDFNDQPNFQASIVGGNYPVDTLGPNMITFLKNFIANEFDNATDYTLVTNIKIYNAPTMTKLRFNYIPDENTYEFSNTAPAKTTPDPLAYDASLSNSYRVVAVFRSPLVVSFNYDGSETRYLTFTSAFDSI